MVKIVIDHFSSSVLQNVRTIRTYLPESYVDDPMRRYPVIYFQDGQNVFGPESSFSGSSWNAHTTVQRLVQEGLIEPVILVGIDHTPARKEEYSWEPEITAEGEPYGGHGPVYAQFLAEELIPYMDRRFRTIPHAHGRAVIGSSMGGLLSFHLALHRPDLFSMAACLSSAFRWADNHTLRILESRTYPVDSHPKLWIDLGDCEEAPIKESRQIVEQLLQQGWRLGYDLGYFEEPGGAHFETYWGNRLPMALLFLFGKRKNPQNLTIAGDETVGISGYTRWLNPILGFDHGLKMTDLSATVTNHSEGNLLLDSTGKMQGQKPGLYELDVESHGYRAQTRIHVTEEVTWMVRACLQVRVPANTPPEEPVYFGLVTQPDFFRLERLDNDLYGATLEIPRHLKVVFGFNRGSWKKGERFEPVGLCPFRIFTAPDHGTYDFVVQGWKDLEGDS